MRKPADVTKESWDEAMNIVKKLWGGNLRTKLRPTSMLGRDLFFTVGRKHGEHRRGDLVRLTLTTKFEPIR